MPNRCPAELRIFLLLMITIKISVSSIGNYFLSYIVCIEFIYFIVLSEEWCIAINNMDYIRQSLPSFIKVEVLFT